MLVADASCFLQRDAVDINTIEVMIKTSPSIRHLDSMKAFYEGATMSCKKKFLVEFGYIDVMQWKERQAGGRRIRTGQG